jgi:hypothetical protein
MASSLDLQIPMHSRKFAPELVSRQSSAPPPPQSGSGSHRPASAQISAVG